MNLIYQWIPWAYSHNACEIAKDNLWFKNINFIWYPDFSTVWEKIDSKNIWVIPVVNSYAWNIHENLYNFLRYDNKIIWEINLEINHCLLSKEDNINKIKKVYSHPQALSQCHNFLKKHNIKAINWWDTAWSAKFVSELNEAWVWALASSLAWEMYNLNSLECGVQDQDWNTTRFFVIVPKKLNLDFKDKKNKTTIIFEAKNIPASLYKCLWAFATNWVNLTKIESLPNLKWPFSYLFWLDFEWTLKDDNVKKALEELEFFTLYIKVLGEY
jgi:prephenate dehydratase